jgi:hypothetical protein
MDRVDARLRELEKENQSLKDQPIKHYYEVTFDCTDSNDRRRQVTEKVSAYNRSSAESMIRETYRSVKISSVVEVAP